VIGNANYPDADAPLKTPVADAHLLSDALRQFEFSVLEGVNLSGEMTRQALDQFYDRVKPGATAVLFFSGYAIQSNHKNYLLPVDARIWTEADVRHDGVDLEVVLEEVHRAGATLQVALIDASRRTPYERRFRSQSAGLPAVNAPTGSMVMYSASTNAVRNDPPGEASNSLFVTELLKSVRVPRADQKLALAEARLAIVAATHSEQVPWLADATLQGFNLAPVSSAPPR